MEFTKEVAEKSGLDMDDEELYAIGNVIKEIKLERRLEEKNKIIEEKDELIKRLKEELRNK